VSTLTRATPVRTRTDTDRRLRLAALVITVIGIAIAGYLTYVHYNGLGGLLCIGGHHGHSSCQTVQSSTWSKLAGVPVALLGLIGYLVIFASLWVRGDIGRIGGFGVALVGFLFSLYLTYREAFSIHAYCEWCLTSAGLMTVLMILTGWRVVRTDLGGLGQAERVPPR
jgi:uncharacterized membrane protein